MRQEGMMLEEDKKYLQGDEGRKKGWRERDGGTRETERKEGKSREGMKGRGRERKKKKT